MNPSTARQLLKYGTRLAVTIALLVVVIRWAGGDQLLDSARRANWLFLGAVLLSSLANRWIKALKLRYLLIHQNCPVGTHAIFGISCITTLYSLFVPGLVSTGLKWYILQRVTSEGGRVLSAMIYNELSLMFVKVLIGVVAIAAYNPTDRPEVAAAAWAAAAVLVGLFLAAANARTARWLLSLLRLLARGCPAWLGKKIHAMAGHIHVLQSAPPGYHAAILGLNLLAAALTVVMFIFAAEAARIDVPVSALVWQSSIVYLLGRIPISIANLGVRELTLVQFLGQYGVDRADALLMSMVVFSGVLFIALLGAGYQLLGSSRLGPDSKPATPATTSREHAKPVTPDDPPGRQD